MASDLRHAIVLRVTYGVGGQHATCVPNNCPILFLPRGEVLAVPLETVTEQLLFAPHLIVDYSSGGWTPDPAPVYPDPANAEVTINGVRRRYAGMGGVNPHQVL